MRRALALATAAIGLAAAPATAQAPAPLGAAHLAGSFQLAGRVTTAFRVRGEHAGQTFSRVWSFKSLCTTGQCGVVVLTRARANGTDKVVLFRRGRGYYRGTGKFFAPLKCSGQVWPRGQKVPFTIKVWITTAQGGSATRIRATYTNHKRVNRTPCVAFLGHDAARYHGYLMPT